MIKTLLRRLFPSNEKRNETNKNLKAIPNFETEKELQDAGLNLSKEFTLDKGEFESVFTPDLGNQKNLILTKWYVKSGEIVTSGDIVCDIENENIVMEFESVFSGRIWTSCKLNEELTTETEIFKVEGV